MRRFRLLTDGEYVGCVKDQVFYECEKISDTGRTVKYYQEMYPEDWQEVFDNPKQLHKDTDLGYFAGLAMQGQFSQVDKYLEAYGDEWVNPFIENSITLAKQLIKQLDKESANNLPTDHNE